MENPVVSIIIPTRGRGQCLRETLRDLNVQIFKEADVWVVDQNDVKLDNLAKDLPNFRLHHEAMPPLGSHAGRNHAIQRTKAKYCIFVDDDVRLESNFTQKHVELLEKNKSSYAVIAGRVVQPKDRLTTEEMRNLGRLAKYHAWSGRVTGNFVGESPGEVDHMHECNFSASTEALKVVNGFNEDFKGNAYYEGTDLALRLIKAGYKIKYEPSVSLIHLQDGKGGNRVEEKAKHTYWMMRNQSLLNSKHMVKAAMPLFEALALTYVFGKALVNKDPLIAKEGLRGLKDGLKYFFQSENQHKKQ